MNAMRHKRIFLSVLISCMLACSDAFSGDSDFDCEGAVFVTRSADKEVYRKPDGTVITKYGNREEAVLPNKTRIVRFADGRRIVYRPDGSEVHMQKDGSVKHVASDKTEKIVTMEGRTPYGMEIKEHRKVLRRRYFVVELLYSPDLSDDNMDKYCTAFFNELASQIERWMYNHRVLRKKVRVAVSNCRFCRTGFCRRKNVREVAVIRFDGEKKNKKMSFSHDQIRDKKKHTDMALKAVKALFGK